MVGFHPIPDLSDGQWVWDIALCAWCNGLEDYGNEYDRDMWMMHSVLGRDFQGNNIQAITGDRVETGRLVDVALGITKARLFSKRGGHWDAIYQNAMDDINYWDKKFEHHCPNGYALQGFRSYHDNHREDRSWKTLCRRVDWLNTWNEYTSKDGDSWPWCNPKDCFNENTLCGDGDSECVLSSVNLYDEKIDFYFDGGGYALTGFGGVHNNHREDRRFWFYIAPVTRPTSGCSWTGFVNDWDQWMDWNTSFNQYIAGVYSHHDNYREERRWRFYVCNFA